MRIENAVVEECRKALELCPHEKGTVNVMCRVCLGTGDIFSWDLDSAQFLVIDCPRCSGGQAVEVCPCLEGFDKNAIGQAIEDQEGPPDEPDGAEPDNAEELEDGD